MRTTVGSAMLQVIASSFYAMLCRFVGHPPEVPSPLVRKMGHWEYHFIKESLELWLIPEPYCVGVQDTNSMDGLIDFGHRLFMTNKFEIENLAVGDPIMYWHGRATILHQIVFIGEDKKGWFCLTKGTNHFFPDLWTVRSGDVISRLVAIIYG